MILNAAVSAHDSIQKGFRLVDHNSLLNSGRELDFPGGNSHDYSVVGNRETRMNVAKNLLFKKLSAIQGLALLCGATSNLFRQFSINPRSMVSTLEATFILEWILL